MNMIVILLKLLLAHLIADFVVQTPSMLRRRKSSRWWLLPHVAAFAGLSLLLFLPELTISIFIAIAVLALTHLLLDYVKTRFLGNKIAPFLADQALHLLLIWVVALCLAGGSWQAALTKLVFLINSPKVLIFLVSVVLTTATGSVLIGKLTQPFRNALGASATEEKPGIKYAGTYIGILERFLILLFILTNNLSAIGFVFAAKSLVRFPESRDAHHFTEYFLIGTTSSFAYAIIIGLSARYLIRLY